MGRYAALVDATAYYRLPTTYYLLPSRRTCAPNLNPNSNPSPNPNPNPNPKPSPNPIPKQEDLRAALAGHLGVPLRVAVPLYLLYYGYTTRYYRPHHGYSRCRYTYSIMAILPDTVASPWVF